MITKSDYTRYLQCSKLAWLHKKRPELIPEQVKDTIAAVMEDGYEVESYAYKLFSNGVHAHGRENTEQLMKNKGVIFQPTIVSDKLYCRADIIAYNAESESWDIYEVKSSTQVKKIHEHDLSFQRLCFEESGFPVGKTYLVHINNAYVKKGSIDVEKLFVLDDLTDNVTKIAQETKQGIQELEKVLEKEREPAIRPVKQCNSPYECIFKEYCLRDIPSESIYTIIGKLSEKTMNHLLDNDILEIENIPDELISDGFRKHFAVMKDNQPYIDKEGIKENLHKIKYPIYYLDYETYGSPIPIFDGYKPYQNIVFQYSLHIQRTPDSALEHHAFLADTFKDPTVELAKSLKRLISKEGTPVAWNMGFEKTCNKEMGERAKEYKDFFDDINDRMYDLMSIFRDGLYIHKKFYGSASLKRVLPVVVPHLSYGELGIKEGMTASNSWYEMVGENVSDERKQEIYNDLLAYCELDTLAMVEILREMRKLTV